ncbi:MAG: HAD hydrolase-like protein [Spirochaetales bacterium]|nr:HAD hydrolase-like protein [Spirochaetales bacterium]
MKYSCILIDHDDTAVDSTPSIHYPAHLEQMKQLGREHDSLSLEDWFLVNYSPGIQRYLAETLKLSEEEERACYRIWRSYTTRDIPPFFDGFLEILTEFRSRGGRIVVVSHSESDVIARHYRAQTLVPGFFPDRIIGWEGNIDKHKPNPWPVFSVMEDYGVSREDILVVDDLKPGIEMAVSAGVDSAAAVWSHGIPAIADGLSRLSTYTVPTVASLGDILF